MQGEDHPKELGEYCEIHAGWGCKCKYKTARRRAIRMSQQMLVMLNIKFRVDSRLVKISIDVCVHLMFT